MITTSPSRWDWVVDVIVAGSGAAGLTAAILAADGGSEVLVLEKADLIGGATGVSGGMPWIPLNSHMSEVGVTDSRQEALDYIYRLTLGREPDPDLIEVYVDTAAEMLDYLEARTPLKMSAPTTFNDYFANLTGGKPAGRSIEPKPFDARAELGGWASRLRTSPHLPWLTMEEGAKFVRGDYSTDLSVAVERQDNDVRVLGAALVASLFKALIERNVAVLTGAAVTELVVLDGQVTGVHTVEAGEPRLVGARQGVILATGGFEWNPEMVKAFIGQSVDPLGPPQNEGDGHVMAMEAGAQLANMSSFWGQPAIFEPGFEIDGRPVVQMASSRSTPGVIVVNRHGQRFVNEGITYQDFPKSLTAYDPVSVDYPNAPPTWMVFDQRVKDRAMILPSVLPGQEAPPWIARGDSIQALAKAIGLPSDQLERTVTRWNEHVAGGEDLDFHRGTARFETHMSGREPSPRSCMAPVEAPPFYAVGLRNGTIGTNGGVRIDANGRVRSYRQGVVPGLYAAGNAAASIFGPAYPGGGATIGPALTFGYLAGRHASAQLRRQFRDLTVAKSVRTQPG